MRAILGMLTACLVGIASPASAQLLQLNISGTLQGSKLTIMCGMGPAAASCLATNPGGMKTESFGLDFVQLLVPTTLVEGDNAFSYGAAFGSEGLWTGIINNNNGVLTGRELYYSYESGGVRTMTIGSQSINARASTFAVTAVPEPATWALMLVGFLAVGTALRRAPRRALLPA